MRVGVARVPYLIFILCFLLSINSQAAEKILVKKVSFTSKGNIEISLSQKTAFKVFTLAKPDRLVVDILHGDLENPNDKLALPSFISFFRSKESGDNLRLVFDLTKKVSIQRVRFEKVAQSSGKIAADIVVDGANKNPPIANEPKLDVSKSSQKFILDKVAEFDVQTTKVMNADGSAKYVVRKIPKNSPQVSFSKKPTIVIDSGHGGKDPGTIGNFARSKEKNITLAYAKELVKQLRNTGRYKVFLTRDDDIFIPLKRRVEIARNRNADLFISLHANAASDKSVSGFSIYTLSEKSSDRQAELLAQKENRADIINGVNFSGASQDIMKTLIDLSQRESMNNSAQFANIAISSVRNSSINILQNTHRFAGFAVLTAPDMISVLIEIGYLSNKEEERLMNSLSYKRKVSGSIVTAIDKFFSKTKN